MTDPAAWNYLIIGAVIAAATQYALIASAETLPLLRVRLASCFISAVANFSFSGLLIVYMKVEPVASIFAAGIVAVAGGEYVLAWLGTRIQKQLGVDPKESNG